MTEESAEVADKPEPPETGKPEKKVKKQRPLWQEIPILLVVALLLSFLLQTFIGRVYMIPSQSMEPTLHGCAGCTGDRIVVEKLSYDFGKPKAGDVVVFLGPDAWNEDYTSIRSGNPVIRGLQNAGSVFGVVPPDENDLVKRVIAVGGQKIECCDAQGRTMVDGKPVTEPFVEFPQARPFQPITVPEGRLFVMGDNRQQSADSVYRLQQALARGVRLDQAVLDATVPVDNVRGKAVFKIWPPGRIGPVRSVNPQS